jgi:hypothetical protein
MSCDVGHFPERSRTATYGHGIRIWRGSGTKMDDRKRSFAKERYYRIAAGLFESAFEACKRLSSDDQQSLSRKIEKQWSGHAAKAAKKAVKKTKKYDKDVDRVSVRPNSPFSS